MSPAQPDFFIFSHVYECFMFGGEMVTANHLKQGKYRICAVSAGCFIFPDGSFTKSVCATEARPVIFECAHSEITGSGSLECPAQPDFGDEPIGRTHILLEKPHPLSGKPHKQIPNVFYCS